MRVVHDDGSDRRTLAETVEVAESTLEQAKGLMFRDSIPDDYALVFRLHGPSWPLSALLGEYGFQSIHMLFVRFPIDVLWLRGEGSRRSRCSRRGPGSEWPARIPSSNCRPGRPTASNPAIGS